MQRIKPSGELVWSNPGDPVLDAALSDRSEELTFGSSQEGGPLDRLYFAVTLGDLYQGMPTPPFLFGFDLAGEQQFAVYVESLSGSFSPRGQVAVSPKGTVYLSSWGNPEGWGLHAYEPGGGERTWSYFPEPGNNVSFPEFDAAGNFYVMHDGAYLTGFAADHAIRWESWIEPGSRLGPSLSPDGATIVIDGIDTAPDGTLAAYEAATGAERWRVVFPIENGTYQAPVTRARFTADGARAYVSTAFGGQPDDDVYGYLYALDFEPTEPGEETTGGTTTGDSEGGETSTTEASGEGSTGATPTTSPEPASTGGQPGEDTGEVTTDGGSSAGDTGGAGEDPGEAGCGCRSGGTGGAPAWLLVGLAAARRRRWR